MNESIDGRCTRVFQARSQWFGWSWFICMAAILMALIAVPLRAEDQSNPDEVGRVTLAIGQAFAHNKKGEQRSLKRGDAVYVDETIETTAGGHVHLRFVDEGTVSLRPNSRLSIELYRYDKLQPQNSAIRLNLEAGVVRSISGKATQAAHDRFRLNTPITAIGVLGTDFVVRAESEKMWAGVYSGAIAISPLNDQCAANGLGACAGATRLSETMGSVMIEFNGGREREKIVPLDPAIISKASRSGGQSEDSPSAGSGRMNAAEIKAADVATRLDTAQQPSQSQQPQQPVQQQLPVSPFTWARADRAGQLPGGAALPSYSDVKKGLGDSFSNNTYGLFRAQSTLTELPRTGAYDFNLAEKEVGFTDFKGDGVTRALAQLDVATLHVDFAAKEFNTHLEMSYRPPVGAGVSAVLDGSGGVGANGFFSSGNVVTKDGVSGYLGMDGGSAALLFRKEVPNVGVFDGRASTK